MTASIYGSYNIVHDQEKLIIMAEVEEMAREFEELASVSPPPPYVERPLGYEETWSRSVATPLRAPSLGRTEPQFYHGDLVDPPDYSILILCVAAFCGWFCICILPCAAVAMVLERKVCTVATIHQADLVNDWVVINVYAAMVFLM